MLSIFHKEKEEKDQGPKKYKTGVVFSGGGTRGFAHFGVLKAMNEAGIAPDIICGVSAGAVAGALYADGMDPEEALDELTSQRLLKYIDFAIPRTGLIKLNGFEKAMKKLLKAQNYEDLNIPLKVFAVNINSAEYHCFEEGPLAITIKASISIPILFPPVKIDGEFYCDGGVINNFAVEPLVGNCERIIGVNVNPLGTQRNLNNLKKIAERTFQLNIRSHTLERKKLCDVFIEPDGIGNYGLLDMSSGKEVFKLGYEAAKKAFEEKGWGK
ncbi:MAG: hypothetical protein EA361_08035 [Bacteroidetes bacterium]|nr:MAG: hypothetical protein EA361_08035 [Bacteroidota bacterium]